MRWDSKLVATFDAPAVFDASSTNIPASASNTLQVVASMPLNIQKVKYTDGIGKYVGLYKGQQGSEVLVCVLGGGGTHEVECVIPKFSRVSVRNMSNVAITSGTLMVEFFAKTDEK